MHFDKQACPRCAVYILLQCSIRVCLKDPFHARTLNQTTIKSTWSQQIWRLARHPSITSPESCSKNSEEQIMWINKKLSPYIKLSQSCFKLLFVVRVHSEIYFSMSHLNELICEESTKWALFGHLLVPTTIKSVYEFMLVSISLYVSKISPKLPYWTDLDKTLRQ